MTLTHNAASELAQLMEGTSAGVRSGAPTRSSVSMSQREVRLAAQ
ncbi:hypothetical protein SynA1544_02378 [Synechococcus sp. A15-44]|nr:hypothetical protein SynA1544_02378 [Synechococcus sp. A15-44]